MKEVFLSLGSSVGNRIKSFHTALKRLKKFGRIKDTSFLYKTDPLYNTDQDYFLNAVVSFETELSPTSLLSQIQQIEGELGRTTEMKKVWKGPRPIDIDILFYGDEVMDSPDLSIPHKAIAERDFVLKPLNDLASKFIHPIYKKSIENLYIHNEKTNKSLSYPHRVTAVDIKRINNSRVLDFSKETGKQGILNCTLDSIDKSPNTKYIDYQALELAYNQFREEGFEFIDIGGESTRPNAPEISKELELERIMPLLEKISNYRHDSIISIDTKKPEVARAALLRGGDMINDVSDGSSDNGMFEVAAEFDAPIVIIHTRGDSTEMLNRKKYTSLIDEVSSELDARIQKAVDHGIYKWNIIADPGVGFAKNRDINMQVIKGLKEFNKNIPYPTLLGFSKKKFVNEITKGETVYGDAALCGICVERGGSIIRLHDPKLARSIQFADRVYKNKQIFK